MTARLRMSLDQNGEGTVPVYDHAGSDETTLAGAHWEPALPAGCPGVRITNMSASGTYRVRLDGTPATADKFSIPLLPGSWDFFALAGGCSIIGTGQVHVAAVAVD